VSDSHSRLGPDPRHPARPAAAMWRGRPDVGRSSTGCMPPSTVGTLLREFAFGHTRQLRGDITGRITPTGPRHVRLLGSRAVCLEVAQSCAVCDSHRHGVGDGGGEGRTLALAAFSGRAGMPGGEVPAARNSHAEGRRGLTSVHHCGIEVIHLSPRPTVVELSAFYDRKAICG